MLTAVYQDVFSLLFSSIFIGTLENDSFSLGTPNRTKWTLVYNDERLKILYVMESWINLGWFTINRET